VNEPAGQRPLVGVGFDQEWIELRRPRSRRFGGRDCRDSVRGLYCWSRLRCSAFVPPGLLLLLAVTRQGREPWRGHCLGWLRLEDPHRDSAASVLDPEKAVLQNLKLHRFSYGFEAPHPTGGSYCLSTASA
jgi:hypothetical protein